MPNIAIPLLDQLFAEEAATGRGYSVDYAGPNGPCDRGNIENLVLRKGDVELCVGFSSAVEGQPPFFRMQVPGHDEIIAASVGSAIRSADNLLGGRGYYENTAKLLPPAAEAEVLVLAS